MRSSQRLQGSAGIPLFLLPYSYMKHPKGPRQWIVDEVAAVVVQRIYQLGIDGYGIAKTAAILEKDEVLKPTEYRKSKDIHKQ